MAVDGIYAHRQDFSVASGKLLPGLVECQYFRGADEGKTVVPVIDRQLKGQIVFERILLSVGGELLVTIHESPVDPILEPPCPAAMGDDPFVA